MAWIDKLVGKSPIGPMQKHMQVAMLCAREVIPLLEAMAAVTMKRFVSVEQKLIG